MHEVHVLANNNTFPAFFQPYFCSFNLLLACYFQIQAQHWKDFEEFLVNTSLFYDEKA